MNRLSLAVENALNDYGVQTKLVILWHMEHVYKLKLEDVPREPERFAEVLEIMFGDLAKMIAHEFRIDYKDEGMVQMMKIAAGKD